MKKAFLFVLMMVIVGLGAFAQDFSGAGFAVVSGGAEGSGGNWVLKTTAGLEFSLASSTAVTDVELRMLKAAMAGIEALTEIKPRSVKVVLQNKRAEIILVPLAFSYKGTDFLPYLPSGLQFFYTSFLEYDFRMVVKNLFLRLSGQLFEADKFYEKLANAASRPEVYLQSSDPEYVLRKFDEYQGLIEGMQKELALLRNATMVLHNRGWFGSINLHSEKAVERLVQLKTENPALTPKEAEDKLKAEGLTLTSNEIFLVFGIYFGQFK